MMEPTDVDELLRDDLRTLLSEGMAFSDTVLHGQDGHVNVHMAFLQVRCPALAERAQRLPSGFAINMPETAVGTLRTFVVYLYTDRATEESSDVDQTFALLQVAQGLYLSDKSCSASCKRRRLDTGSCAMRRLSALCEQRIRDLLTSSTVVEILLRSVRLGSSSLENYVYEYLAHTLPAHTKDLNFSRCLIEALGKDHQDALARAISATAGNAQQTSDIVRDEAPPPCLFHHLQSLWLQTFTHEGADDVHEQLAKPDCKMILSRGADMPPDHLLAHRFLLAARSKYYACMLSTPMKESQTGELSIGVSPVPSMASVRALLKYLYTGSLEVNADGQELNNTDLLDMLSVVDGPGGQNYLQLAREVCDLLRNRLSEHIKANLRQDNMWMVLRRATAQRNEAIRKEALMAVFRRCQELSRDEVLFQCWGDCTLLSTEDWWTPRMENELLRDMLRFSCTASSKTEYHDEWELEVSHPAPEGLDNVFNQRGNKHLLQEWADRGSACRRRGSIIAKFANPVHVDFVSVAPLDGWGSDYLKNAKLHVKNADGIWERVATASGRVEQIPVYRRGKTWRLHGDEVATSVFKFRKEPARPCSEFEHTEKARCRGSDGTFKYVYFKFPLAVHVDDVTVPADPVLSRTQLQVKNADGQWEDVGAQLTGRSQLVWVNRDGRFWRLRNFSGLTTWEANIFTFTSK